MTTLKASSSTIFAANSSRLFLMSHCYLLFHNRKFFNQDFLFVMIYLVLVCVLKLLLQHYSIWNIRRTHFYQVFYSHFLCIIILFNIFLHLRANSFIVLSITLIRKEMRLVKYMLCQGHENLSLNI